MNLLRHCTLLGVVAVMTMLSGCEAPPHQPYPQSAPAPYPQPTPYPPAPAVVYPAPAPAYSYADIRRCRTDNQRVHAEVLQLFDQARAAGRISPNEAQRFGEMDGRVRSMAFQLERDGLTMNECVAIRNSLEQNRNEVIRMTRSDPGVGRCIADNRRAHDDIYAVYNRALAAGRIRPGEAQRFQAMEKRLAAFQADMKRNGYTLGECQAVSRSLARERAAVDQMIRNP